MDTTGPMSDVEFSTSDFNHDDDNAGLEFIGLFMANQKLNDYYNTAVDAAENVDSKPKNSEAFDEENQENVGPSPGYV